MKLPLLPVYVMTKKTFDELEARRLNEQKLSAAEIKSLLNRCIDLELLLAKYGIKMAEKPVIKPMK